MRLIDADSLIELFTPWVSEDKKVTYQPRQLRTIAGIVEDIKNAPTVEAIPIEWLLEWERKYNESLPPLFRGETVIKEVIRDWRSEHETD